MLPSDIDFWAGKSFYSLLMQERYGFVEREEPVSPIRYMYGGGHNLESVSKYFDGAKVAILHWIGTDVLYVTSEPEKYPIYHKCYNLCDWYNLRSELKTIGVDASVAIAESRHADLQPIQLGDDILVYMPDRRHDFFRYDLVKEVENKSGRKFVYLTTQDASPEGMMRHDVIADIARCKTLIRTPIHDSFSNTVAEMLLAGRSVLNVLPMPYCEYIRPEVDDIVSKLDSSPHPEAPDFYRHLYRSHDLLDAINRIITKEGYEPINNNHSRRLLP